MIFLKCVCVSAIYLGLQEIFYPYDHRYDVVNPHHISFCIYPLFIFYLIYVEYIGPFPRYKVALVWLFLYWCFWVISKVFNEPTKFLIIVPVWILHYSREERHFLLYVRPGYFCKEDQFGGHCVEVLLCALVDKLWFLDHLKYVLCVGGLCCTHHVLFFLFKYLLDLVVNSYFHLP